MNTDFRVAVTMTKHLKIKRLIRRLGYEAFYSLACLWTFAAVYQPKGSLADMTAEEIEEAAEWDGTPGELVAALVELRLLDVDEAGGMSIHDWDEHNEYAAGSPERSAQARKAANARWGKADNEQDAQPCGEQCSEHERAMLNSDAPKPKPKPEPIIANAYAFACAEPPRAADAAPPVPAEPALMVFPLARNGETWPVTQKDVDEWRESFPGIDVTQELRACLQWNRDNPTRRKTKGGIRKHISGWLAKAQNQVGRNDRASPKSDTPYRMTGRQRYMYELGNRLIPDEPEDNRVRDIIDITPNDHAATTQLEAAERRTGAPGRALPGSAA